ncbi:T9SS type A sorting domain-containing protein [Odoribacter sp. OttesenSCG-928-L07]|nr:T9SS type A sorting domain-containing protein [Odoribacter sp. OttesenSCG-928-L07]MDL2238769.1 T9SS type A sorting domain-containing protein [Bacteroidales bacterium OttesenSCG-928-L14]MDL2241190.1 T9SS type A sorting domain-containing protein [Bacteroidales bacterium OttesenSCG-928-K22]
MKKIFTQKTFLLLFGLILCGSINAQTKISNYSGQLTHQSSEMKSPLELWDVLYSFDYTEVAGVAGFYAPFYWEGDLYISRWDATAEENELGKIYKFVVIDDSWSLDETFVIPDVTGENNFEGFTSDGTYIFGVNETEFIYQIDPTDWTVASKIEVASSPVCIAYDSDKEGFWIADFIDFTATFVGTDGVATGESLMLDNEDIYIAGLAYDNTTEDGPYLWTSCYTDLHRWNINSEEFENNVHSILDVPGTKEDDWNSNIYIYKDIETGNMVLLGLDEESYLVYAYDFGSPNSIPATANQTIKIYPNPASDVLKISDINISKVEVYNITGQLVYSNIGNVTSINVSDYNPGVYTLVIFDESNVKHAKKFVVSK